MRLLISALTAASVLAFSLASCATDEPYPANPNEPGRPADKGQTVTAPTNPKSAGRVAENKQTVTTPNKPDLDGRGHKPGR
jgi:hypothetical protein